MLETLTYLTSAEELRPPYLPPSALMRAKQLDRLDRHCCKFAHHLGTTIHRRYLSFRLYNARRLLRPSTIAIGEVALSTGVPTPMRLARCYRCQFGAKPLEQRRMD